MNIIISGAGKVGFNLAKVLSIGHSVTIIDKNAEALSRIQESLDILAIHGSSEDRAVYEKIKDKEITLYIAVTNDDNVNLVSLMVADIVLTIERKMVRIKNRFFNNSDIKERLGIENLIFPIDIASKAISTLLAYPETNNVKFLKHTKYKLFSIMISKEFTPKSFYSSDFPIIGIERNKKFFVTPHKSVEIQPNDLVYLIGLKDGIEEIYRAMDIEINSGIKKCVVFGAEPLGVAISQELVKSGKSVKIIEKNMELCRKADEELEGKASIINTIYGSHDIFKDEGLGHADMFIATSKDDEFNIIKCLEAKESGIQKVIAINNEIEYYGLMHLLGIIAVRGPKINAYNSIIEEVNSTHVILQKFFCGSKGVLFIRKVFANSKLIDKDIKPPKTEMATLYCIRDEVISPIDKNIIVKRDDLIIVFTIAEESQKIKEWLYGL